MAQRRARTRPEAGKVERVPRANRIIEGGLLVVAAGTPLLFSIWSKNNFLLPKTVFAESVLTALVAVWGIKVLERGRIGAVRNEVVVPSVAFLAVAALSLVHSVSWYLSVLDLGLLLSYFAVLFLVMNFIRRDRQRDRMMWVLVGVCLIASTYAVCQYFDVEFSFWARQGGRGNLFSTFGNPNRFSGFVGAVIPPMVGYFLLRRGYRKVILGITIAVTYTGVLMTFTRGAWAGLFFGTVLMMGLWLMVGGVAFFRKHLRSIATIVVVIALITPVFMTRNPLNRSRYTIAERAGSAVSGEEGSVVRRPMIWRIAVMMLADYPVLGTGIGTFKYHYLDYQGEYFEDPAHQEHLRLAVWAREAHNEYVQIFAEMGIAGIVAWMWLLVSFFRGRITSLRGQREERQIRQIGFTAGAMVVLVHAVFSFPLHIVPNGILLFLLMGLSL